MRHSFVALMSVASLVYTSGCGEVDETSTSVESSSYNDDTNPGVDAHIVADLVAVGVAAEKVQATFVYASASQVTDEHLKIFATMPELKTLSLGKNKIDGSGLKDLNCPKLRGLLLFETQVTDATRATKV